MVKKIKKLFSHYLFPKKGLFLVFFLFFLALGLIFPKTTFAFNWFSIIGFTLSPVMFIVGAIFGIFGLASQVFFQFAHGLANWVITDVVFNVPLTQLQTASGQPTIVGLGWTLTRDLADVFFILVLAWIALATILRVKEYEAKKTLPKLIIIALLINFTPVIVGIVVDFFNILTNFFLLGTADNLQGWSSMLGNFGSYFWNLLKGFANPSAMASTLVYGLVVIVFYFLAALVFLLIAIIFFFRIIAIWMLVILAPIAFWGYIMPATKGWWSTWWKQLMQWSFIGAVMAFFMYLGSYLLNISGELINTSGFKEQGVIVQIIPNFVSLIFLLIGIMFGMQSSAVGANMVIGFAKKAGTVAKDFAGRQTAGRLLSTETGKKTMTNLEKTKLGLPETREEWKKASWGKKIAGGITAPIAYPLRWGIRKSASAGLQYGATQPQEIEKRTAEIQKKFGKDYKSAAASYNNLGATDYQGKIAMAHYLTRTKGRKGLSALGEEQQKEAIKLTAKYDSGKLVDIVKHATHLIKDKEVGELIQNKLVSDGAKINPETGKYEDNDVNTVAEENKKSGIAMTDKELIEEAAYKKAVDAMKSTDLENADPAIMNDPKFKQAVAQWKPWSFIHKIAEEWGADMLEKLQDSAEEFGLESVARTNPTFIRAAYTPQGEMFMRKWQGIPGKKEANKFILNASKPQVALPANLMAVENAWVQNLANGRLVADPSKTLAQHTTEAKQEYEKKYRKNIFATMRRPEMQALRDRRATQSFAGRQDLAWDDVFKDIAERQYREDSLPILTPKPTNKELKDFKSISEGKKTMPRKLDLSSLRKIQGALRVSHFAAKKQIDEIARKALELQQKRATASAAEIAALKNELNAIETELSNTKSTEMTLKGQEVRIKRNLSRP